MARIHPTAIVDAKAQVDEDVEIGPYCIVEDAVTLGAGTVLRSGAVIRRYTTLGRGNFVDSHTVIGGDPQDFKFDPRQVSYVRIGDNNIIREYVTISRATGEGNATIIGNNTMWMTGAHAGHNAVIEDNVILVNGSAVGGHATIGTGAILSAHALVHQFCWIGRNVMTQGQSGFSTHVPPFTLCANINCCIGLNGIGLRRNPKVTETDRAEVKEAFKLLYRRRLSARESLAAMDAHTEWGWAASEFRQFIHNVREARKPHNRGLCPLRRRIMSGEE
ncbi:MAG: acyl-ACP--UDP-N-acetylglucosamine O-acyltransferase [Planctomycetaceae bacterium]|nr:acyl-ACP--UDP-N-acetylglucosamine O-acyltransferase [Planctomycetaceae bacterium]